MPDRLASIKPVGSLAVNGSQADPQVGTDALPLFRRWAMKDLLAEPDNPEWLVRSLLASPTYGQIAGEMKTLKSYVAGFIAVGLAAGVPIFERFTPTEPRPVLAYVGEGGRMLWTRRIRRICQAVGVVPSDLDLHPSFDTAPLASIVFQESLARDLADIKPALLTLDPLYTFHGLDTRASDLMQEGALLNKLSGPCMEVGASPLVVNHFNQGGSGLNLKRITMAGSGEWADSWLLLAHRVDPDVSAGRFQLTLEVGSRQWGGRTWELDLDLGRFDEDLMTHVGEITWDLRPSTGNVTTGKRTDRAEETRTRILEALTDEPARFTKTELKSVVGGNHDVFLKVFADLADSNVITHDKVGRTEGGKTKSRVVWALTPTRPDTDGPSWKDEDF
jgi:hypothetical protein